MTPTKAPKTIGQIAREHASRPKPKPRREGDDEPERAIFRDSKANQRDLLFILKNGTEITGHVLWAGNFTVDVQTPHGQVLLYKHAIENVNHPPLPPKPAVAPELIPPGAPQPPSESVRSLIKNILGTSLSNTEKIAMIEKVIAEKERRAREAGDVTGVTGGTA